MNLPMTAEQLASALSTVRRDARVFVMDPDEGAVADGPPVTGLTVRGGDVYLDTTAQSIAWGDPQ